LWYRVYVADKGADATGGVGLPDLQIQQADGTVLTGAQACNVLAPAQTVVASPLIPAATYSALRDQTGKPAGFPAVNPGAWMAQYNTQYGLQCMFLGKCGGAPVRQVLGKGAALIPSSKKRAGMGTALDIPLGHKDAAFVRSHFDGMEVQISDAPRANEIMVAVAVTDSGRPLPRVGGLTVAEVKGEDGLR